LLPHHEAWASAHATLPRPVDHLRHPNTRPNLIAQAHADGDHEQANKLTVALQQRQKVDDKFAAIVPTTANAIAVRAAGGIAAIECGGLICGACSMCRRHRLQRHLEAGEETAELFCRASCDPLRLANPPAFTHYLRGACRFWGIHERDLQMGFSVRSRTRHSAFRS
jgi:hypothetical protein